MKGGSIARKVGEVQIAVRHEESFVTPVCIMEKMGFLWNTKKNSCSYFLDSVLHNM